MQEAFLIIYFTLPNYDAFPPGRLKFSDMTTITLNITLQFVRPEGLITLGHRCILASGVLMPEAAVDEDDSTIFGKNDIGFPWHVLYVKAVAEAF